MLQEKLCRQEELFYMYQIVTDGSWDLGRERARELDVAYVPYSISLDGEHYLKEVDELEVRDFYRFMVEHPGVFPKTSQPAITDYVAVFEKYASKGMDIVCFCLSSKFSGSFNVAQLAREQVLETFSDIRIEVMDSTMATLMQGMLVKEMVLFKRAGGSFENMIQRAKDIMDSARIFFTVGSLDYLVHGGRVGKLAGVSAKVLNLKPMILMTAGELFPMGLARGRVQSKKKAIEKCIQHIRENGNDPAFFDYMTGYGYDIEEGHQMEKDIRAAFKKEWPDFEPNLELGQIGATIGVHTGPYPIGLGLIEKAVH